MKKISIIIFTIMLQYTIFAQQPLWNLPKLYVQDSSLAALQSKFFNAKPGDFFYMDSNNPAYCLAYYYGNTQKDTILKKIPMYYSSQQFSQWGWYYNYQFLRGYFGDQGAIAGMDTVARFMRPGILDIYRTSAIKLLADLGYYNYFDTIQYNYMAQTTTKERFWWGELLVKYAKNPLYTANARNVFENFIINATEYSKMTGAIEELAKFDKPYAVQLLKQKYQSATGSLRKNLFSNLGRYDVDGQPERTMESVLIESNEYKRVDYFPSYYQIIHGASKRYLEPFYVKFCIDWLQNEVPNTVTSRIKYFLEEFIPLPPSTSTPADTLLQKLTALKDTMVTYNWVGGANYIQTLTTTLNNAKTKLQQGDTLNTAYYITYFKNLVDTEHQDTLNTTTDFITTEAWKYLHYNAQYLLEKLPNIEPTLTSLNGSMTLAGVPTFTLTFTGEKFTIGTVAQWNGQPLPTTYISSTQLQCTVNANLVQTPSIDSLSVKTVHYISNTKPFSVVTQFPQPLTPIFNCITMGQQGNYTAYFGYNNQNTVNIILPKGTQNILTSPFPLTTNPPEIFEVGTHNKTFNVTTKGLLKWLLNGTEVQATAGATRCQ